MSIILLYIIFLVLIYFFVNDSETFGCSCDNNYSKLFNLGDSRPFFSNQEPIYIDDTFYRINKYKPHKYSLFTLLNPFQKLVKNINPDDPSLKNIIKASINA